MSFLNMYLKRRPEGASKAAIAIYAMLDYLQERGHTVIVDALIAEYKDQNAKLKLIASENHASLDVFLASGNWLSDKYAEGVPYARYYAGCENVDVVEQEAIDLAKKLFGAEHANVQPPSGVDANLLALMALLARRVQDPFLVEHGAKNLDELDSEAFESLRQKCSSQVILGMGLSSGGHLTHGMRANVMSRVARFENYHVGEDGFLDMDHVRALAKKHRPAIILAGYSAYPRKINFAAFRDICDEVGADLFVDMAHFAGLVAGKVFTGEYNPVPYADIVTSTTHKTLRGPRGGLILSRAELKPYLDKGCPMSMGGPLEHQIAAKAVCFKEALQPSFGVYAENVVKNARLLASYLQEEGVPITTGGTDNHMVVANVHHFGFTGRQIEKALTSANMTVNRNMIPKDTQGPWYTSGIRMGTAALTTRGMGDVEVKKIAGWFGSIVRSARKGESRADAEIPQPLLSDILKDLAAVTEQFLLYRELEAKEILR